MQYLNLASSVSPVRGEDNSAMITQHPYQIAVLLLSNVKLGEQVHL